MAEVTLARERAAPQQPTAALQVNVVCPGESIAHGEGLMRGHGTFLDGDELVASVTGIVQRINKVVSVRPIRSRFVGEIGDVVVGRIVEVGQRRWLVDVQARLHAILKLSSVNLPGGVLRRKSATDELMMREFFKEGDLISAEVQTIFQEDGTLSLHTRSLRYGRLGQGLQVRVPSVLVRRSKSHFHTLPCGVAVVLGKNGYIWIGASHAEDTTKRNQHEESITHTMRENIARVRNCIMALSQRSLSIFDTTINCTYDDSVHLEMAEILLPANLAAVTSRAFDICQPQ